MKIFKKNQILVYVIALMIMTAGYLNYTTNPNNAVATSVKMDSNDGTKVADIGDATLVSSNDIANETEITETNNENSSENNNVESKNETNSENTENYNNTDSQNTLNNENTSEQENITIQTNSNNSDDYFQKSKLDRDTMYSQMIETYEKVLNSSNSLETQKQTATQEIQKINEIKNSIMICENLIKTKGFENNIVFVNGESISVIIGTENIKQDEVAQIQNIISRELKANVENIHIATK